MISAVRETSKASIDEVKFHLEFFKVLKFSKEWKIWLKTHFLVLALFVGNFSNKHHYNFLKILRTFCFRYFCPKWLFSKLIVLKVDLCNIFVALIKIKTVYRSGWDLYKIMRTHLESIQYVEIQQVIISLVFESSVYVM